MLSHNQRSASDVEHLPLGSHQHLLSDVHRRYPQAFSRRHAGESRLERLKASRQLFNYSPRVRFGEVSVNGDHASHHRSVSDDGSVLEVAEDFWGDVPERPATTLGFSQAAPGVHEDLFLPLGDLDEEPTSARLALASIRSLPTGRLSAQESSIPAPPTAQSARADPSPTPSTSSTVSGVSLRERLRDNSRSLHDLLYNKVPFRKRHRTSRNKSSSVVASCEALHLTSSQPDDGAAGRGSHSRGKTPSHYKSLPSGLDTLSQGLPRKSRNLSQQDPPSLEGKWHRQLKFPDLSPLARIEADQNGDPREHAVLSQRGTPPLSPWESASGLERSSFSSCASSTTRAVGRHSVDHGNASGRQPASIRSFHLPSDQDGDMDDMASTVSAAEDDLEKSLFQQYLRVLALPSLGQTLEESPSPTPSSSYRGDNSELEEIFSRAGTLNHVTPEATPSLAPPRGQLGENPGVEEDDDDDTDPRLGLPDLSEEDKMVEKLLDRTKQKPARSHRHLYSHRPGSAPIGRLESPAPSSMASSSQARLSHTPDPSPSAASDIQTPQVPFHLLAPVSVSSESTPGSLRASELFRGSRQGPEQGKPVKVAPVQNLFGQRMRLNAERHDSPREQSKGRSASAGVNCRAGVSSPQGEKVEETAASFRESEEVQNTFQSNASGEFTRPAVLEEPPPLPSSRPPSVSPHPGDPPSARSSGSQQDPVSPKKDNPVREASAKAFSPEPLPPPTCMETAFDMKLKHRTRGKIKIVDLPKQNVDSDSGRQEPQSADLNVFSESGGQARKSPKKGFFPKLFGNKQGHYYVGLEEAAMMGKLSSQIQRPNSLPNLLSTSTPSSSPNTSSKPVPSPVRSEGATAKYPSSPVKPALTLAVVEIGNVESEQTEDDVQDECIYERKAVQKDDAQFEDSQSEISRSSQHTATSVSLSLSHNPYEQSVSAFEEQEGQSVEELMANDSRVRFRATPIIIPSPPESSQSDTLVSVFSSQSEDLILKKESDHKQLHSDKAKSVDAAGIHAVDAGPDTPRSVVSGGGDTSDMEHVSPLSLDSLHDGQPDLDHLSTMSDETGVATLEQISDISEEEENISGYAAIQPRSTWVGSHGNAKEQPEDFSAKETESSTSSVRGTADAKHTAGAEIDEGTPRTHTKLGQAAVDGDVVEDTSGFGSPENLEDSRSSQNNFPESSSECEDVTSSVKEKPVEKVEETRSARSREVIHTATIEKGEYAVVKPKPVRGQVLKTVSGEDLGVDAGEYAVVTNKTANLEYANLKEKDVEEDGDDGVNSTSRQQNSSEVDDSLDKATPTDLEVEPDYATVSARKGSMTDNNYEVVKEKPPAGRRGSKGSKTGPGAQSSPGQGQAEKLGASSPYATIAEVHKEAACAGSEAGDAWEAMEDPLVAATAKQPHGSEPLEAGAPVEVEESLYAAVDLSRKSSRGGNSSQPTTPPTAGPGSSDITSEGEGPPLPVRQYKRTQEQSSDLSGSRSSLFDNLKDTARSKLRSLRKAVSMERGMDTAGSESEGKEEKKKSKHAKRSHGSSDSEKVRKAPSLKSLAGFFKKSKSRDQDDGLEVVKSSKGKKDLKSRWLRGRGGVGLAVAGIEAPTGLRSLGRVMEVFPDGSQMVELFRPESGPLGFYISRSDDGLYVSRFADSHPVKLFSGLVGVGDEIVEINGQSASSLDLEQAQALLAAPGQLLLRLLPPATRSDK